MKHLERFKKMMNLALKLEWIDKNPFANTKLKFEKYEKEFLTKTELSILECEEFSKASLNRTNDIFIFACYTGLSFIDVKNLTHKNIVLGIDGNRWIYTKREKNDTPVKIPLLRNALHILKKYENQITDSDKLLPVISNQKINKYLKEINTIMGIRKKLTFHSARHTFATTVTLSNGVPIETVSKLLGHTKLSTTQIYARVLEQKISDDMNLLSAKLEA
jgi:integrase